MFINTKIFTKINLLNVLILLVPLSLIIGNLAVNLNVVLICLVGIVIYGSNVFKIKGDIVVILLCIFFLYLILITLFHNIPFYNGIGITPTENAVRFLPSGQLESDNYIMYENAGVLYKEHIIKSLFFTRFLIFFLVINKAVENKIINFKYFFIFTGSLSFLVATDIFINVSLDDKFIDQTFISSFINFFGEEKIAGGYLQKFSLFFIFSLILFSSFSANKKKYFVLFSLLFFFFAIIFTNNRMPLMLYVSSILLFFLIEKKYRKFSFLFLFLILISIMSILKFFPNSKSSVKILSFKGNVHHLLRVAPELFYYGKFDEYKLLVNSKDLMLNRFGSGHLVTFNSGVQVWKQNKIFGGGLKSFRLNCKMDHRFQTCNTHPHNYLIEILVDVGLVGFIFIYFIFSFVIINFLKNYQNNLKFNSNLLVVPFFLILFFEFFPLRSTGSFFTTSNSVVIFLVLAVVHGYYKKIR